MACPISQARGSASNIVPVVIVLRNVEVTSVLGSIVIAVANQRGFPVVMEVRVGNCHPFRGVGNVN